MGSREIRLRHDSSPYLAVTSPELPSVSQAWVDHEPKEAQLAVALAGSNQRMMQGLVMKGACKSIINGLLPKSSNRRIDLDGVVFSVVTGGKSSSFHGFVEWGTRWARARAR